MTAGSDGRLARLARALQVLGRHTGAGVVDPRPGPLREAAPARKDAPVIEHVRDVQDRSLPAFRHAQHQVVVLDALEAGPQAAQPAEHVRPHGEGMVHVVLGQQPLAVEVGLEARLRAAAVGVDGILVRIDRDRVRTVGEGPADQR